MQSSLGKTLTPLSIILVLISALIHSSWNFFTKRGNFPVEFFFWVFLWGTLFYLPFFFIPGFFKDLLLQAPGKLWTLSILSSLIQTLYLISLIKAYQMAELSLVYPISRSAPLFTQVWAVLFIGEILSLTGIFGIGLVVVGIFVISMSDFRLHSLFHPSQSVSPQPYLFAMIAAVAGSVYSVLDKVCVQMTHPVFYCWLIIECRINNAIVKVKKGVAQTAGCILAKVTENKQGGKFHRPRHPLTRTGYQDGHWPVFV